VAETHTGRVWRFEVSGPGEIAKAPFPSPNGGSLLASMSTYRLFDSLAIEANGNVCVASLFEGGITVISPDGKDIELVSLPDIYTTNICFGGPELKTAFITLSTTGKLVSVQWPRAGARLHHLNT
jgi:gluconolactonase